MADRLTIAMQKVGHYLLCGWREVKIQENFLANNYSKTNLRTEPNTEQ